MKENIIYNLAEEIKLESGQASDLATIFGKYRHRETSSILPQGCHQQNAETTGQIPQLTYKEKEGMEKKLVD